MSLFGTGRREGILAVLLLATLAVLSHLPGIAGGEHRRVLRVDRVEGVDHGVGIETARRSAEGASNQTRLLPALRQAGATLEQGELPLWNRHARFGEPFSVSGAPVYYPPYWIVFLSDAAWTVDLLLALHTLIACVGMFRFLRVMPMSRYVSFVCGGTYGLGWFMTASLDRLPEAAAAALLPFALECTWRCLSTRRRQRAFVPGLGVVLALMFASGSTSTAWFGLALCASVLITGLSAIEREHRLLTLRMAGMALLCTVTLTAPLWLEWMQFGDALAAPIAEDGAVSRLQPAGMLATLAPNLFGDLRGATPSTLLSDVNPAADPLELVLYPGALVLFLAILGLFRPKRSYQELFWVVVAGVGLVLAVDSPLHNWIGWAGMQPGATLVLFHVAATVLAAVTLETFFDAPIARRFATPVAYGASFAAAAFVLSCRYWTPGLGIFAVGLFSDETSASVLGTASAELFRALTPSAIAIALIGATFAIWQRIGILRFKPILACIALGDVLFVAMTCVPRSDGALEGLATAERLPASRAAGGRSMGAGGRGSFAPGSWVAAEGTPAVDTSGRAILSRTAGFLQAIDPSCVRIGEHQSTVVPLLSTELLDHPLLEVAAVETAPSRGIGASREFRPLTATPLVGNEPRGEATVLVRNKSAERARLIYRSDVVSSEEAATASLRASSLFDVRRWLVETENAGFEPTPPTAEDDLILVEDRANRVSLRADLADGRGYLTLADACAPGWTVEVDGRPVPIHPGNVAFRSVPLLEGQHDVVFDYRPWSWTLGMPFIAFGLALTAGYWLVTARAERRAAKAASIVKPSRR